jgi:hypothetical protein
LAMQCSNPFAFRPGAVTFWTTISYIALFTALIWVHETVPPAPADHALYRGLNLSEAWLDLQNISNTFHPYNSRENDRVREFLIVRSKEILQRNKVFYTIDDTGALGPGKRFASVHAPYTKMLRS